MSVNGRQMRDTQGLFPGWVEYDTKSRRGRQPSVDTRRMAGACAGITALAFEVG
jgi:hypothetical protein